MSLTILVPLDGSPLAERALPYAAHLAARGDGRVVLAHVRSPSVAAAVEPFDPASLLGPLHATGVAATAQTFDAMPGEVAETLHAATSEAGATLVVMSTHGRGGLRRSLFGSVADQVIRRAVGPVLLIPPDCKADWEERSPSLILVPLDGSHRAEEALGPAIELARTFNAELLLVRVLSPMLHTRYRDGKMTFSCADFVEVEDAWNYLSVHADAVRATGCRASIWVLVGAPATAIAEATRTEHVDVIVMTTHGRHGVGRLLLGSTADGILHRTGIPVLLVKEGAPHRPTWTAHTVHGERPEVRTPAHIGAP